MTHGEVDTIGDPLIGQVLSGRFEIVAPLGAGGMGRVYKAIQRPIDRVVALKVLNPRYDGTKDPGFERRFFLEASMTAKLKHPNTITVHDYGRTDQGVYFIAMEYLEGETLAQCLKRDGPMPWHRALVIAGQVARSLREAHKLGMVHRDLKPANVMLLREGTGGDVVKVLDFGLVKSFQAEKKPLSEDDDEPGELTQAGVLLGSPLYMAPEQAKSEVDGRTDIYSLGTVLFQCIAGRTPFQGRESIDIIVKQIRETPPELRSLVPSVPLEVNALVMRCLEKAPEARFQSMDELLLAMRAATSGQGLSGIFADPRTTSGAIRSSDSGLLTVQGVSASQPTSAYDASTPHSIAIELSGPSSAMAAAPASKWRTPVLAVGAAVLISAGALAAYAVLKPRPVEPPVLPPPVVAPAPVPAPAPVVVAPAPVAEPAPVPVEVTFTIDSEPAGANVLRDGQLVGTTPMTLAVARPDDGPARAELAFELPGYQPVSVVAMGSEGTVPVKQTLKKVPAVTPTPVRPPPRKPPPQKPPPGFKDDPYQ